MLLLAAMLFAAEAPGTRAEANVLPQIILVPIGGCDTPGQGLSLALAGHIAYVADGSAGMRVIDVSDPGDPVEVAAWQATLQDARDVVVAGATAYVADGPGGLQLVDISEPTKPEGGGWYPTAAAAVNVAVAGQYAYVVSGYDLQIFDLTLPAGSAAVGHYWSGAAMLGLAVAGDYAYVTVLEPGGPPGSGTRCGYHYECSYLEVVNITDTSSPQREGYEYLASGIMGLPAYTTLAALDVAGAYAYVGDGAHGLVVVDVSNPSNPVSIGRYQGVDALALQVTGAYAHLAGSEEGLYLLSITDPAAPAAAGSYDTAGTASGVAVAGTTIYIADGEAGLVIFSMAMASQRLHLPLIMQAQ